MRIIFLNDTINYIKIKLSKNTNVYVRISNVKSPVLQVL